MPRRDDLRPARGPGEHGTRPHDPVVADDDAMLVPTDAGTAT